MNIVALFTVPRPGIVYLDIMAYLKHGDILGILVTYMEKNPCSHDTKYRNSIVLLHVSNIVLRCWCFIKICK